MHSRRRLYDIGVPVQLRTTFCPMHTHTPELFYFYFRSMRTVGRNILWEVVVCEREHVSFQLRIGVVVGNGVLCSYEKDICICVMRTEMHFSSRPVDNLIQSNDDDD